MTEKEDKREREFLDFNVTSTALARPPHEREGERESVCLCVCEGFEPCTLYKPQSIIQAAAPPSRCAHGAHKAAVKGWREEEEEEGNKLKVRTASCSVPLMPGCWPLASLGFIVMTFSPRLLRHCMKAALSLANKMGRWRPSQKAPPPKNKTWLGIGN